MLFLEVIACSLHAPAFGSSLHRQTHWCVAFGQLHTSTNLLFTKILHVNLSAFRLQDQHNAGETKRVPPTRGVVRLQQINTRVL